MTRGKRHRLHGRAVNWLIANLPAPLLIAPERVAIKFGVAVIGLTTLIISRPQSLNSLLPHWVIDVWGVTWLLGGLFGLLGYFRSARAVEQAGHRLIILGGTVYMIALAILVGWPAFPSIILFAVVAGCSVIRLLVAAGARASRRRTR